MGVINTNWNAKHASCLPKSNTVPKYNENGELTTNTAKTGDDSNTVANTQFVQRVVGTKSNRSNIIQEHIDASGLISLPSSNDWISIVYGNCTTIIVGSEKIIYSTDKLTWTDVVLPKTGLSYGAYGNGTFVVLASTGAIYSTDVSNWNVSNLSTDVVWADITFGDGKFVAISKNNNISAYSEDGISWEIKNLPVSTDWTAITYGNGKFVAVDSSGTVVYSTDAITWESSVLPTSSDWTDIAYGNGKFVAIGESSGIAYSMDAEMWIMTSAPIAEKWSSIAYGNGVFLAVAYNDDIVCYSTNASSWYTNSLPISADWIDIACIGGSFIAISMDGIGSAVEVNITVPVLIANNWDLTGEYPTYLIESDLIASGDTIIELYPNKNINIEEYSALQYASIIGGDQGKGYIQLIALGEVPTIDIPVTFIVRGDM